MKRKLFIGLLIVLSVMIVGVTSTLAQEAPAKKAESQKLNLNIATLEELKALPGIITEMAQAIIEHRPYQKVEDLLKIQGITEELLTGIKEKIAVKKLNLNSATIDELKALPGMTPEIAEAIIEGRPYKIVDELLKIKGIGEKELTKLQDFLEAKPPEEENDSEGKGWQTRERNFPPQPAP